MSSPCGDILNKIRALTNIICCKAREEVSIKARDWIYSLWHRGGNIRLIIELNLDLQINLDLRDYSEQTNGWSLHYFYDQGVGKIQLTLNRLLLWQKILHPPGPAMLCYIQDHRFNPWPRVRVPILGLTIFEVLYCQKYRRWSHVTECLYCLATSNK